MISICIPIYNVEVKTLVKALEQQMIALGVEAELVLFDDASEAPIKDMNRSICAKHKYKELEENVGRSKIRNLLAQAAQYDYLLFLDCDATIISDNLLEAYLPYVEEGHYKVLCGGSIYPTEDVDRAHRLRWKNGNKRETIPAAKRMSTPYNSFMTSNVLIHKDVFKRVVFDESLTGYGHEDTFFGYQLKLKQIPIIHLDNPVLNNDLDTNESFLNKTREAVANLAGIVHQLDYAPDFIEGNKLLMLYSKLKRFRLLFIYRLFFFFWQKPILNLLKRVCANLVLLQLLKLGWLLHAFMILKKN